MTRTLTIALALIASPALAQDNTAAALIAEGLEAECPHCRKDHRNPDGTLNMDQRDWRSAARFPNVRAVSLARERNLPAYRAYCADADATPAGLSETDRVKLRTAKAHAERAAAIVGEVEGE